MKPVIVGDAQLWHGDCLRVMKRLPEASVDLILCDLPYGVTNNHWDSIIPLDQLWEGYKRVLKPGAPVVLTACQPFTSKLLMSNEDWFRYEWIWMKPPSGFLNAKNRPMASHESVLVFCEKKAPYYPQGLVRHEGYHAMRKPTPNYDAHYKPTTQDMTNYPKTLISFSESKTGKGKGHPTKKPVALMRYMVQTYTQPDEVVMDNTMGGGSTGVACLTSGRRFIGIELGDDWFSHCVSRMRRVVAQPTLFQIQKESEQKPQAKRTTLL